MVDAARREELALARANKELDYWEHIDFMDDPNQPHQGPPDDLRRSSRRRPRRGSSSSRASRTRGSSITNEPNLPLYNQPSSSSSVAPYPPPHYDPTRHPAFPGHLNLHDPHQNFGHLSPSPLDSSLSTFQWPSPVTPGGLPPAWSLQQPNIGQYPVDPHGFPHFPPQTQLPPMLPGTPSQINFPVMPPPPPPQQHPQHQRRRQASAESSDPQQDEPQGDALAIAEEKRKRNTLASARFRIKKKQRSLNLERTVSDLEGRAVELEKEASQLRSENGWLKEMVIMKGRLNRAQNQEFSAGETSRPRKKTPEESESGGSSEEESEPSEKGKGKRRQRYNK